MTIYHNSEEHLFKYMSELTQGYNNGKNKSNWSMEIRNVKTNSYAEKIVSIQ